MPESEYIVHDNGGRPFKVVVYSPMPSGSDATLVQIHRFVSMAKYEFLVEYNNVMHVMVGKNPCPAVDVCETGDPKLTLTFTGNTIILQLETNRYVFIGRDVYEFSLADGDIIEEYYSPVVNSDVPYPVIRGTKYGYFMLDKKMILIDELCVEEWSDAYGDFYEQEQHQAWTIKNMPNVKIICERLWR